MEPKEYRERMIHRPPKYCDSNRERVMFAPLSRKPKGEWDEENIVAHIIAHMKIAGQWISAIMPNLYFTSGPYSGLMITMSVPSKLIDPSITFPGDIDILAIPYDKDALILSQVFAVEIKVIRGNKRRPGKSPNKYGFSQATSLLDHGFPHVAVGHVIVTRDPLDEPNREVLIAKMGNEGKIASYKPAMLDMFECDLTSRAFGKLESNCNDYRLGYFSMNYDGKRIFEPLGHSCGFSPMLKQELLRNVKLFYEENYEIFFEMPRYSAADIAFWNQQARENPKFIPPWERYRNLFGDKRILSIETLAVRDGGEYRLGYFCRTEDVNFILYDI